jgi:transposase
MSSVTKQRVGKYTYLYESESYWDAQKKRPDNKKTRIGKIDLLTGEPVYTKEYLAKLVSIGESVVGMRLWDRALEVRGMINSSFENGASIAQAVIDSVKDFGVVYFLQRLSESIGLLAILHDAIPNVWQELLCLAYYLVAADKPVMYCEEWVASNAGLDVGSMSSQRISDLLTAFGCQQRNSFYSSWYKLIREKEYIALDITSVSSYSEQIEACEWGYNRDGEDMTQVNICMLFGETSKLPVYQTIYSGSLRDVSTLKATISEFTALADTADIMIVMDKGFFSAKNVNMLLGEDEEKQRYRFLLPIPFTSKFAKSQVESERKDIDSIENVILTSCTPIRGIHKLRAWSGDIKLHTHIFFNPEKAVKERNELFGYVASLARQAAVDPYNEKLSVQYKKYLIVRKSQTASSGVTVSIREDVVAKELETVGWFVLLSNHIEDPQAAHDVYRMKDVVEKSFWKYKNSFGLKRLRVHSDERMENKIFIAFIALIITSAIHETMKKKDLFKYMTFDRLILTLAKLKSATVNGKTILRPVTKAQADIFEAFGILSPDIDKAKVSIPKKRGRKPKSRSVA